jgi:hypothetical protein
VPTSTYLVIASARLEVIVLDRSDCVQNSEFLLTASPFYRPRFWQQLSPSYRGLG